MLSKFQLMSGWAAIALIFALFISAQGCVPGTPESTVVVETKEPAEEPIPIAINPNVDVLNPGNEVVITVISERWETAELEWEVYAEGTGMDSPGELSPSTGSIVVYTAPMGGSGEVTISVTGHSAGTVGKASVSFRIAAEVVKTAVVAPFQPQGSIVVSLTGFPNSLDISMATDRNAFTVGWHLFDSLVWLDENNSVVPALATDWEISDYGDEYIFYLRQDVTFHNGEPFTADAVVISWERGQRDEMPWRDDWLLATAVEKIDDYTVRIYTDGPLPTFLFRMAESWAMVPPGYLDEVGEEGFGEHPIGTGPYMFVEWGEDESIILEANPNYWDEGLPRIQTLIFRHIPDSGARLEAILNNDIDIAIQQSAEEAQSLLGIEGVKIVSYPQNRVYYIAFNNLTTGVNLPTENPLVRQAMNYAVDRQAIVDALYNGYGRLSTTFVTPTDFGFDPDIEPFPFDQYKARELLAEAGYPDGFEIEFRCPDLSQFVQACSDVQSYLQEVGIYTNLEFMKLDELRDLEANKDLPGIFGDYWGSALAEPIDRIEGALGPDSIWAAWNTDEITDLIYAIKTTMDENERYELYVMYQKLMQEDPPFIWLFEPLVFEALRDRVQNYRPRPAGNQFLKSAWVITD